MKTRFVDPFFPNRPVQNPEYFEGRKNQVEEAVDALYQTKNNNPKHFIISGDRGIGKSSLLLQVKLLSEGNNSLTDKLRIDKGCDKFDYLVSWVDAVENQSLENLVVNILTELQSTIGSFFSALKFEFDLGGFVQISKKEAVDKSIADVVNEFCKQIKNAHEKLDKRGKHGIIIFIDELDKMNPLSGIASFLKLSTEKLNREGITNISFACSGITGAVQKLETEHASIFRTLRDIPLQRFTEKESEEILSNGFEKAGFTYDKKVVAEIFNLANGFPEPLHIIGSEILSVGEDMHLTIEDFTLAKEKVIKDVRKNKLGDLLKRAGYGKYQLILEAMSTHASQNVPLEVITKHLNVESNQISTNIGTLIDKEIITRVDRSVYSFVDPLLKEYIKSFGVIKLKDNDEE
jgi:Cdc6-like AAA superfamily ATPase